eukprot:NODE_18394_length_895_cov_4.675781.p2 GENE.NODE_18394_length_895_cov_4.675781~~NODE_18394_length_895_cov_4.675781.p2  ORF type:complete len:173 (-),score=53.14 NODE_18394_length_895_cov_4.675781:146-664(-)
MWQKMYPQDGSTRVPMIFSGPGVKAGSTVTAPTTNLDFVGTFLEAAGANFTELMTTKSLWPVLRGDANDALKRPAQSGLLGWRMVVKQMNATSTLKLVCCPCCPSDCKGFPPRPPMPRHLSLLPIGNGTEPERDMLSRGIGAAEAAEMLELLPSSFRDQCKSALDDLLTVVV